MRLQFCGADRTVTGSSHLLEAGGVRVLLDCGMYQGSRELARTLNNTLVEDVAKLDAIVLSHGHLDHCGKLPVAIKSGYGGSIYCTPGTAEVATVVLLDSAKIQEEDAEYLNNHARGPGEAMVQPLYTRADVHDTLKHLRRVDYGVATHIAPAAGREGSGITFTLFDAGHILGSAYVICEFTEDGQAKKLLFTADIGRYGTPILRDPVELKGPVDWFITESTYGDRSHGPVDAIEPQLLEAVRTCIERRSRLIVPSFAVGRTQTVLWYLQKFVSEGKIKPINVYVDSPMGVEVSKITAEFPQYFDDETKAMLAGKDLFGLSRVTFAVTSEQSKAINADSGPCVIIASSPTCEFGRVLHHIKHSLGRKDDLIVFVGWIPPQTLGRRLQNGEARVKIYDRWFDRRCEVRTIHGLSAHADGDELLRFLKPTLVKGTAAFVVHGEVDQAEAFARRLIAGGAGSASIPSRETAIVTSGDGLPVKQVAELKRTDAE